MLVQPSDLTSELYQEIIDEITRENETEVINQIKAAEDFCKSYLFKFDLMALFGDDDTPPTVIDSNLKKTVKIIASYWIVRKANPNVNLQLFRDDWEMMIGTQQQPGWLTQVKEGYLVPNWPYKPDDPSTPEDESDTGEVAWYSNNKRRNYF
jgi:hypothetical protein